MQILVGVAALVVVLMPVGMTMFVAMGVTFVLVFMAVGMVMPLDFRFALAAAADCTHVLSPE